MRQRPVTPSLQGITIVITRPAGTGSVMARQVRAYGGVPLLLPGLALRGSDDDATRKAMTAALQDDVIVFNSPAAVRYAARLQPLRTAATVLAVGQGTARALRRHGLNDVIVPPRRQDSEGVLALDVWAALDQPRIALIAAPGGRGLLREQLATRGSLRDVCVYRRSAPRLRASHWQAVLNLPTGSRVLFSSAEAVRHLHALAPADAWSVLASQCAVVSSERLAEVAHDVGFALVRVAASANGRDLLAASA